MMKRFKHSNIVPLLGVCTRSEPVYAVMEFQLHGKQDTYSFCNRGLMVYMSVVLFFAHLS